MTRPITLLGTKRRRGNPDWGKPMQPVFALTTEFEREVERLGLTAPDYVGSAELRRWCASNRNRVYVPEWLLKAWEIEVEAIFSGVA